MVILGIETSCDETGVAIVKSNSTNDKLTLLANKVSSSLSLHSKTGGIIPEFAAREQVKYMIPVLESALKEFDGDFSNSHRSSVVNKIDAIAVTVGPGLIGSLLIGAETARTLAYLWNKPIIPVNHLIGHIYANFIDKANEIEFPALSLIVSGGHTDLVLLKDHGKIKWLGGTRDDAAGEAFDKIGRILGLPYPGGPSIENAAENGNSKKFEFPRPLLNSKDFDFSFSGLKTAVFNRVKTLGHLDDETITNISAAVQEAIVEVLIKKTLDAAKKYNVNSVLLGGGVASNNKLREKLKLNAIRYKLSAEIFVPQKFLCTDNAAMIASAAIYNYKEVPWQKITANPELYFN